MFVLLFIVDWLFLSYILILAGGLGMTICLWYIGQEGSLSIRRKTDYLQIDLKDLKQKVQDNRKRTKDAISELHSEIRKLQKKIEEK